MTLTHLRGFVIRSTSQLCLRRGFVLPALFALVFIPAQQAAAQAPDLAVPDRPTFTEGRNRVAGENILTGASIRFDAVVTNTGGNAASVTLSTYRMQGGALTGSAPPAPGTIECAADTTALCREIAETSGQIFGDGSSTITVQRSFPTSPVNAFGPPSEPGVYQYYVCVTNAGETTTLDDNCSPSVAARVLAATANIDGNTAVNHLDGLVMYFSLNSVFRSLRGVERFRDELMGHLTTTEVTTTQELVDNAVAWQTAAITDSDVDGIGGVTHLDGLVIYFSLNPVFNMLRGTDRFRDELMGHLTTTEVATTQGLVDNANALVP